MAHQGQTIFNPRTGQRMEFLEISKEELRFASIIPPAPPEPMHIHPKQVSGAKVSAGELVFEVDGEEKRVGPGESIEIPAGVKHRFRNEGDEDVVSEQYFRPALDIASFFETFFALAQRDELDEKGMPNTLQLVAIVPEFGDEIRPVSPPWPVLQALSAVLGPVARMRGYEPRLQASSDHEAAA